MFKYFDYEELYELGKTSVFFMNNIIEYLENNNTWPEEIRKLISKYGFQIHQGEVDLTLKLTKKNKRRYKYPNEENKGTNYYQFDLDGNRYISIANSFRWAHQDNNNYWTKQKAIGSYEENGDVYYLVNVCWLDTKFHFYVGGHPTNSSVFGGIMSLIFCILSIIIMLILAWSDLKKMNPITSKSEIPGGDIRVVNLHDSKVWVPFRMVTYEEKFINHKGIVYPSINLIEGNLKEEIGMDLKVHNLNYTLCNETSMANVSGQYKIDTPLNELFCQYSSN